MRKLIVILALFALVLTGCTGGKKVSPTTAPPSQGKPTAPQPTSAKATPTQVPATATPVPTKAAATKEVEAEELAFEQVDKLDKLQSYRLLHEWSWKWEKGDSGQMKMYVEFVREPKAQRILIESIENGQKQETSEMIFTEGTLYIRSGDRWTALQSEDMEEVLQSTGWWGTPDSFLAQSKGRYVGKETINGIPTKHYHFSRQALLGFSLLKNIKEARADVWVSPKYNVFIKVALHWEGFGEEDKGLGTFDLVSTLSDINKKIEITPPAGIEKPSVPEDIPIMKGASKLNLAENMINYQVAKGQDEVINYYKAQMQAKGWKMGQSVVPNMLQFSKEGRTATIMIEEENGQTTITIIIQK